MDPVQFVWEVAQALFGLIAAVAVPGIVVWWLARRSRNTTPRGAKRQPRQDH